MLYDNPGSCVDGNKRESLDGVYFKSKKLDLLLKWTKFVCAFHGIKVCLKNLEQRMPTNSIDIHVFLNDFHF